MTPSVWHLQALSDAVFTLIVLIFQQGGGGADIMERHGATTRASAPDQFSCARQRHSQVIRVRIHIYAL